MVSKSKATRRTTKVNEGIDFAQERDCAKRGNNKKSEPVKKAAD